MLTHDLLTQEIPTTTSAGQGEAGLINGTVSFGPSATGTAGEHHTNRYATKTHA